MTTRFAIKTVKSSLILCLLASLMINSQALAKAKALSYNEALDQAGAEGVIAYCYGPDWNARSTRMLKSFWKSSGTKSAAGGAIMIAVPFYQNPHDEKVAEDAAKAIIIQGSMPAPPLTVCPSVMMFDKTGRNYAKLIGSDFLGDESGSLGQRNISVKLAALKKQQELLEQAKNESGAEKAKLLSATCELGIAPPEGIEAMIQGADPSDTDGYLRRYKHNALLFMYKQLDTTDGFLKPDFVEDPSAIKTESMKIIKDAALREEDRQAAYNLIMGSMRRAGVRGGAIKAEARNSEKIAPNTKYGVIMAHLGNIWANNKAIKKDKNARKKEIASKKAKNQKNQRKKDAERNFDFGD